MTPETDRPFGLGPHEPEDWEVEALSRLDSALATGTDPGAGDGSDPTLSDVHDCQRLLEAIWPRAGMQAPAPAEEPPAGSGRIGKYVVERELGRGGFGVVFLAEDRDLNRRVAVKVPRPEFLAAPDVRRRFLNEAKAAGRLDHPGIVPVHATGSDGPVCYIVSAYCEGPTLARWLRDRTEPVPCGMAARLLAAVAGATHHAHTRGIVHRDLKPSNILLPPACSDDPTALSLPFRPKVCDFGLARLLDADVHDSVSGLPIGSPAYMAPEQAEGRNRDLGPATDVHALGIILYEVLIGHPPYRGESPMETIRLISSQTPVPPRRLRPDVPRALEAVCLKCLEKAPARRYGSAEALADDLARFLAGRPVFARLRRCRESAAFRVARTALPAAAGVGLLAAFAWYNGSTGGAAPEAPSPAASTAQKHRLDAILSRTHVAIEAGEMVYARQSWDDLAPLLERLQPEGYAWGYLRARLRPAGVGDGRPHVLTGHTPFETWSLAFSPDGRRLASAGDDHLVRLWDPADGRLVATLSGHTSLVTAVTFSPDGQTLASSSFDGSARLWNASDGRALATLWGHSQRLRGLCFAPDGRTLATTSNDRTVRLWDLKWKASRAVVDLGPGHEGMTLAFSADGKTLAVGGGSGHLTLIDPEAGVIRSRLSAWHNPTTLAFAPDGRTLAQGDDDGRVDIWDLPRGLVGRPLNAHPGGVLGMAFSPDGLVLATAGRDMAVRVWDTLTGQELLLLKGHAHQVHAVAFAPDGLCLATGSHDGAIRLWWADPRP